MKEAGLLQKVCEHFGKIMNQYTQDKIITGNGYIEFTDRKIEVIDPSRIYYEGKEAKVKIKEDKLDKAKLKDILKLCMCKEKEGRKIYSIPNKTLERLGLE